MKRWILVAFLIGLARVASAQVMSPGPLSDAHASLDSDDHCDDCHEAGDQVSAQHCLACHKELKARVDAGEGLHGKTYAGKACEDCHHEHIGRSTKLVRWPGGSMDSLDHDDAGWKLDGAHADTKCLDCHKKRTDSGKPSFLGLSTRCGSCHKDEHQGRLGDSCTKCHDQADWKTFDQRAFDHGLTRYKLTGAHTDVACEKCHHSPAQWTGLSYSGCASCHDDPHKGKFAPSKCEDCHQTKDWKQFDQSRIRGKHPWLSLKNGHAKTKCETCHDAGDDKPPSKGKDCVGCHKPVHEAKFGKRCESCHASIQWMGLPDRVGRDAHTKTAYPLDGKHADVACDSCHPRSKSEDKRFRGLTYDRCGACHADQHGGEFASRDKGECGACHKVDGFATSKFGLDEHATTTFALVGRHAAVPCGSCHTKKLDFRVQSRACADCHQNPHGDQFTKEMSDGGCAHCHTDADWKQAKFDHSTWPLTGVHATTACGSCHPGADAADPKQVAAFRGVPRDCEGCHDDVHAGQFRTAEPKKTCDHCHQTNGFQISDFDHEGQSGYKLEGKHTTVACASCHPTVTLAGGTTAVRYRLGYRKCKDCHADPHEGAE